MPKIFLTFGQDHIHHWKGQRLDKDCVVIVEDIPSENEARSALMVMFNAKFCTTYSEEIWEKSDYIKYYPRGYIKISWEEISKLMRMGDIPASFTEAEKNIEEQTTNRKALLEAFQAGANETVKRSVIAWKDTVLPFFTNKDIREASEEWYKNEYVILEDNK